MRIVCGIVQRDIQQRMKQVEAMSMIAISLIETHTYLCTISRVYSWYVIYLTIVSSDAAGLTSHLILI